MNMLERIEVVEKIGQGGMANVFLGYLNGDYGFKKEIVVKKILKEHFNNERYLDMFVDEASISAKLNHSNIVQVFDFFEEHDELHILMEYVNGGTLRDLMVVNKERDFFIPIEHVLFVINNLLTGMDFYHNKRDIDGKHLGIIHRDLTPKNVLVSIYGEIKISDFGIAKFEDKKDLTSLGEVKGKPSYMSPEQIKLLPNLDNRVDLFSLGIMFYELLTNSHPFREGNIYITQQNIMSGKYIPISDIRDDLDKDIEKIVYKLLEVNRDNRYLSAGLVKKDLLNLKEKISTQLVFSRYATEILQPGYVNYLQSILPDVHSKSDFRMINKDEKSESIWNNKKLFIYGIALVVIFNIALLLFTVNKNNNVDEKLEKITKIEKNDGFRPADEFKSKDESEKKKEVEKKSEFEPIKEKVKEKVQIHHDESVRRDDGTASSQKEEKKEEKKVEKKEKVKVEEKKVEKKKKVKKRRVVLKKAVLDIYVIPFGNIFVNGKKISSVTKLGYKIKPGKHKIEIKDFNGNIKKSQTIRLKPGEKKELRFKIN